MENKVVLDFSKCDYSDAAPYDEQSLIHRSKMRQIMRMWDQLYDNAIEVGENTDFHRFHSTISNLICFWGCYYVQIPLK